MAHLYSTLFLSLGIVLRFIQGAGDACVSTAGNHSLYLITLTGYSVITIEFPKRKEIYLGYCSAAVGLGLMLGPVIGQTLYTFLGFDLTFYAFAIFLSVALLMIFLYVPNYINFAGFDTVNELGEHPNQATVSNDPTLRSRSNLSFISPPKV